MDKLKMGNVELMGTVHFTTARVEGQNVPALELRVEGPVEQAALDAMKQGCLEIYGQDDTLQGEHKGYGMVARHSIVLAKVSDVEQELMEARAELEETRAAHAALLYESLTGEVL